MPCRDVWNALMGGGRVPNSGRPGLQSVFVEQSLAQPGEMDEAGLILESFPDGQAFEIEAIALRCAEHRFCGGR